MIVQSFTGLDDQDTQRCTHTSTQLKDSLRLAHCALDVKRLDILPMLLQKRHQKVDSQNGVRGNLVLGHVDMSNSHRHAQDLLQLELDGRLELGDLRAHVVAGGKKGGELARLVEAGT